jgi:cardiolipin synthase A/B
MSAVFERDLELTKPFTYELWLQRSFGEKFIEQVLRPIKSQL